MYVKIDAAQLEWRGAVWLSNDPVGIAEINTPGTDIHENNRQLFGLPSRLIAKIYLFRTIFRGTGWAFANDPAFSFVSSDPAFWDDINEKFYKKYKGLDNWHQNSARTVVAHRPLVSPFGREWLVPLNKDGSIPWTTLSNWPVQGTCADLMSVARISLLRRMRSAGLRALLVSTVHDDIKVDAPEEEVPVVAKLAVEVFRDIPKNVKKLWNVDLPIPFPGEVKVGKVLLDKYEVLPDGSKKLLHPDGMDKWRVD